MRDDLPDLLRPVLVLSELGNAEAARFVRWRENVQGDLAGKGEAGFVAGCLSIGENTALASAWADHLLTLIEGSLRILGTDKDAVESAFTGLEDKQDEVLPDGGEGAVPGAAG